VITVHDAFAWILPKEAGRLRTLYWRWMIAYSVKFVAAVIAVSVSTRNDLLKHTQVNHSKVHVIPEAGDHVPLKNVVSLSEKISDVKGYFIAVGFFKAVKNPFRILAAYEKYRATMLNKGSEPFGFKLIGAIYGLDAKKIREMASLISGIEILGRIDDAELHKLIGEAHGFIFPSIYEGFGLPILEAQRLGCPVLTSWVSSMPEVAGAGALLVDPLDIESIYQGMLELHCSEKRVELVRKGLDNESRFSWRLAYSKTFELLCSVAQQKNDLLQTLSK
jgi:glycosyltransferase involved in cell wall biosynthesis